MTPFSNTDKDEVNITYIVPIEGKTLVQSIELIQSHGFISPLSHSNALHAPFKRKRSHLIRNILITLAVVGLIACMALILPECPMEYAACR